MIRPFDPESLAEAEAILRGGGLVGLPTETVYGLAADAFQAAACAQIFAVKERPSFDPLIVHILDLSWLPSVALVRHASNQQDWVDRLAKAFWPGPLTLVLPKSPAVPSIVTSGLETVAVRVPAHPAARALLERLNSPLAAPSANRFGRLSPTRADHVAADLGQRIPLILDGGPCAVGVESTIVDLSGAQPCILRHGGVTREQVEAVLGFMVADGPSVLEKPLAPGQLPSHYAPTTPLTFLGGPVAFGAGERGRALLAFQRPPDHHRYGSVQALSAAGDPVEAASRLFDCLHKLDQLGLEGIDAEPAPGVGLGLAINDRLRKAAVKQR